MEGADCSISPSACLSDNSVTTTDDGTTCPTWKVSTSSDDDAEFEEYMVTKDSEKESDKKWTLYSEYIADDLTLWDTRDSETDETILSNGIMAVGNAVYSVDGYVAIAVVSVLIIVLYYIQSKYRSNYQKI